MKKKRITALLLMIKLLVSMFPTTAMAAIDPDDTAYYREGAVIIGGDGGTYQFPKSEQGYIKIRYIDLATGKWKVYDRQYEHGNPKRTYVLKQLQTCSWHFSTAIRPVMMKVTCSARGSKNQNIMASTAHLTAGATGMWRPSASYGKSSRETAMKT